MAEQNERTVHNSFWANIFNSPAEKIDLAKSLQTIPLFNSLRKRDLSNLTKLFTTETTLQVNIFFTRAIRELVFI